jgi:ElaB/YqjD/DUF883 family membrane-anchored ribosome-binding protein
MRPANDPLPWAAQRARAADLERLLGDLEQRLSRLARMVPSPAAGPAIDRVGEAVAAALNDIAEKFRTRARAAGAGASRAGEDALQLGNDALRKLAHEVEQRPLVTLAIAVGVGALAAGLLARR